MRLDKLKLSISHPRRVVTVVGAAALALGGVGMSAISASAQDYSVSTIRSWHNNVCFDSNYNQGITNPPGVYAIGCNGGDWQKWIRQDPTGVNPSDIKVQLPPMTAATTVISRLVDKKTGHCLDSNRAGQVYTFPCWNGDLYQTWLDITWPDPINVPNQDNVHEYINAATGMVLNVTGNHEVSTVSQNMQHNVDQEFLRES